MAYAEKRQIYGHIRRICSIWKSHVRFGPTLSNRNKLPSPYSTALKMKHSRIAVQLLSTHTWAPKRQTARPTWAHNITHMHMQMHTHTHAHIHARPPTTHTHTTQHTQTRTRIRKMRPPRCTMIMHCINTTFFRST